MIWVCKDIVLFFKIGLERKEYYYKLLYMFSEKESFCCNKNFIIWI